MAPQKTSIYNYPTYAAQYTNREREREREKEMSIAQYLTHTKLGVLELNTYTP